MGRFNGHGRLKTYVFVESNTGNVGQEIHNKLGSIHRNLRIVRGRDFDIATKKCKRIGFAKTKQRTENYVTCFGMAINRAAYRFFIHTDVCTNTEIRYNKVEDRLSEVKRQLGNFKRDKTGKLSGKRSRSNQPTQDDLAVATMATMAMWQEMGSELYF